MPLAGPCPSTRGRGFSPHRWGKQGPERVRWPPKVTFGSTARQAVASRFPAGARLARRCLLCFLPGHSLFQGFLLSSRGVSHPPDLVTRMRMAKQQMALGFNPSCVRSSVLCDLRQITHPL